MSNEVILKTDWSKVEEYVGINKKSAGKLVVPSYSDDARKAAEILQLETTLDSTISQLEQKKQRVEAPQNFMNNHLAGAASASIAKESNQKEESNQRVDDITAVNSAIGLVGNAKTVLTELTHGNVKENSRSIKPTR